MLVPKKKEIVVAWAVFFFTLICSVHCLLGQKTLSQNLFFSRTGKETGRRVSTRTQLHLCLPLFHLLSEVQVLDLDHLPLHHHPCSPQCSSSSPFPWISSFYSGGETWKTFQPKMCVSSLILKRLLLQKWRLVLPLRFCLAQRHPFVIQWVLVVQQVLMQRDLRTEEEVMGKEQPATQHSHLGFPGTRASAENMYMYQMITTIDYCHVYV